MINFNEIRTDDLEKLSLLLGKQLQAHNQLLELETRKTQLLVHGRVEELDELLREEQTLIMSCSSLEKRRLQQQKAMDLADEITLHELAQCCDRDNVFALNTRFEELSSVLSQLKRVNRINAGILHSRLNLIGQFLSVIGLRDGAGTYRREGTL